MAQAKDGGQQSFDDKPLMDEELATACEAQLENKGAVSDFRKASATIKERLPQVTKPTRFLIGERYFIYSTPYSVDGHDVKGGKRQKNRVTEATSD